eukprot:TRINITY_DN774043_c0_g1_i1.p1 TRINITY_DN774043_c0_g1~~TRINITY_DN774043_c0_g1_i1.p1  ORF type:complete len:161 (+),score=39.17 TRINITY_DN774043_c0_g1_i1:500-982(+)
MEASMVEWGKIKVGTTLAFRYGAKHWFLDGSVGIRCESLEQGVMFIPHSLKEISLMAMLVNESKNKTKKCLMCGKNDSAKSCGACRVPRYCSKSCQVKSWKKDHKKVCKFMHTCSFDDLFLDITRPIESSRRGVRWWQTNLLSQLGQSPIHKILRQVHDI